MSKNHVAVYQGVDETLETVWGQITKLDGIADYVINTVQQVGAQEYLFKLAFRRLKQWRGETAKLLLQKASKQVSLTFLRQTRAFEDPVKEHPLDCFLDAVDRCKSHLNTFVLKQETRLGALSQPLTIDEVIVASESTQETASKTVFIVYGHDEINLLKLEKLLEKRWSLTPIILGSEPGKGRTLIEMVEEEGTKAEFALVLMTPDDEVVAVDSQNYRQARPNVVFELGWLCANLERKNVCILLKKGTKIHSDLDGIRRVEFIESVGEKVPEIEEELKAAGLLEK